MTMSHFFRNKSEATKALVDEKRKIGQANSKSSINIMIKVC